LRSGRLKEPLAVQIVDVLIIGEDEAGKRLPEQSSSSPSHPEHGGEGEIGLHDEPVFAYV
jgi:hypothetical protein